MFIALGLLARMSYQMKYSINPIDSSFNSSAPKKCSFYTQCNIQIPANELENQRYLLKNLHTRLLLLYNIHAIR